MLDYNVLDYSCRMCEANFNIYSLSRKNTCCGFLMYTLTTVLLSAVY